MRKYFVILLSLFILNSSYLFAEEIVLKSGKIIHGKIVQQENGVLVKVFFEEGIVITYFWDDIQSITDPVLPLIKKGIVSFLDDKIEIAIESFKKALTLDKEELDSLRLLGVIERSKTGMPSKDFTVSFFRALQDLFDDRYGEAIEKLININSKYPHELISKFYLGYAYASSGNVNKAISFLETVVKSGQDDGEASLFLGRLYRLSKNYDEAKKSYVKAKEIFQKNNQLSLVEITNLALSKVP